MTICDLSFLGGGKQYFALDLIKLFGWSRYHEASDFITRADGLRCTLSEVRSKGTKYPYIALDSRDPFVKHLIERKHVDDADENESTLAGWIDELISCIAASTEHARNKREKYLGEYSRDLYRQETGLELPPDWKAYIQTKSTR